MGESRVQLPCYQGMEEDVASRYENDGFTKTVGYNLVWGQ